MIQENAKEIGGVLIQFRGASYDTTAQMPTDDNGNSVNYNCFGIEIENLSASNSLLYSLDGTNYNEIKPLGSKYDASTFDKLYVKAQANTVSFQGSLCKVQ